MILRACYLILCGALSGLSLDCLAQDTDLTSAEATEQVDRLSGFEVSVESNRETSENADIFTDLSSITVELEPVKLPDDQSQD